MSTQSNFIDKIAPLVQQYAPQYGIECNSAVIAQACLESGYGLSRLSAQYHNYFGLKCGTKWTGASVNMRTSEEYTPGVYTNITDNFRVYSSMEEGVKGYFEFIQLSRYKNLKGITDPLKYLETIRADGYATSSTYVVNCMAVINSFGLRIYDTVKSSDSKRTATDYLDVMRSWIGYSETNGKFKIIIDLYNSHKPLARNYKVKYSDEWCDTCISAAAIKAGMVDLIGTECGCEAHVKIFQKKGIWIEDGKITPKPGYIILYNWGDSTQPNDGYSDHIGVVESVTGKTITAIEGNKGGAVTRRKIPVGWGYIRGYAAPKYGEAKKTTAKKTTAAKKTTDSKKVKYVKELQTALNKSYKLKLAVDGSCGPKTQAAIDAHYLYYNKKKQIYNAHVGWLQDQLAMNGYTITVDKYFGPKTENVLKKFQSVHDLEVDGYAGVKTHLKLIDLIK